MLPIRFNRLLNAQVDLADFNLQMAETFFGLLFFAHFGKADQFLNICCNLQTKEMLCIGLKKGLEMQLQFEFASCLLKQSPKECWPFVLKNCCCWKKAVHCRNTVRGDDRFFDFQFFFQNSGCAD